MFSLSHLFIIIIIIIQNFLMYSLYTFPRIFIQLVFQNFCAAFYHQVQFYWFRTPIQEKQIALSKT